MAMIPVRRLCALAATVLLAGASAQGAIVSGSGAVSVISAPTSVAPGALESNTTVYAFNEKQGLVLTSALAVDFIPPLFASAGTIASGQKVDSHFVHFDRAGATGTNTLSGSVTFDGIILGLIFDNGSLDGTDGLLGSASTTYPASGNPGRRFDFGPEASTDIFTISGGQLTFNFTSVTSGINIDQMRIVTATPAAPIPEPGSLVLAGLALLSLAGMRSRRKQS